MPLQIKWKDKLIVSQKHLKSQQKNYSNNLFSNCLKMGNQSMRCQLNFKVWPCNIKGWSWIPHEDNFKMIISVILTNKKFRLP